MTERKLQQNFNVWKKSLQIIFDDIAINFEQSMSYLDKTIYSSTDMLVQNKTMNSPGKIL